MEWVDYIVSILSGLAVCIPLAVKLVQYVKKAVREKNWGELLRLVMGYMDEAEERFEAGADKKEWVMAMIDASAGAINYDIDKQAVSELIDSLCGLSKRVNPPEGAGA